MAKKTANECMEALWQISCEDIPIWAESPNIIVTDKELRTAINAILSNPIDQSEYFNWFREAIDIKDQARFDQLFSRIFWKAFKEEMEG